MAGPWSAILHRLVGMIKGVSSVIGGCRFVLEGEYSVVASGGTWRFGRDIVG